VIQKQNQLCDFCGNRVW